jgi:hypothetical protein
MTSRAAIGIGLMCKPPRPGASKTRLAATLGATAAAALARAFLIDTAATITDVARADGLVRKAFFRPSDAGAEIRDIIGPEWPLAVCDAGDLGASMREALEDLLIEAPAGAIVIGADLPDLPASAIARAAAALRAGDARTVVAGPTADGGYYLIGLKDMRAAPLLAPMAWSTPTVMAETRRRAAAHDLHLVEIEPWHDIDEAADLARIASAPRGAASATRAALGVLGLGPPHA